MSKPSKPGHFTPNFWTEKIVPILLILLLLALLATLVITGLAIFGHAPAA